MKALLMHRRALLSALAASSLGLSTFAPLEAASADNEYDGVRLQADNDLFAGQERDEDYTGGLSITLSGDRAHDGLLSLDAALAFVDAHMTPNVATTRTHFARQLGFMAFTPNDIEASDALPSDRPYASLLFVSNGRMRLSADERSAWFSSLTVGVLGLSASEQLQNGIHSVVGSPKAQGYDHQISAGGEPTARYVLAHQHLLFANPSGTLDVKTTVQGSVGFLTEASAAMSMRYGLFGTAWWSHAPELTDYMAAPVPSGRSSVRPDIYFLAGARLKARAYNAFLQGQFRNSDVRLSGSELEPILMQAWIGFVTEVLDRTQLSYTLNYQSAEIRRGDAARDALWGSVQVSRSF